METILIFALFILAYLAEWCIEKWIPANVSRSMPEYCRNRCGILPPGTVKGYQFVLAKVSQRHISGGCFAHRLKEGLYFNSGGSTEWQEEFAQVIDELNRESADEQQRFYQESKAVSPYTDGINLDAYYRIFGLTPGNADRGKPEKGVSLLVPAISSRP